MASGITVRVRRNDLPRMAARLTPSVAATVTETAETILTDAKRRVHVITGGVRDSGHIEPIAAGVAVVFDDPGAVWEEYGTRYRPGHPFLTPAAEAQRGAHSERVKRALGAR